MRNDRLDRIDSPYWALRLTFGLVPIIAGIDKFFDLIVYPTQVDLRPWRLGTALLGIACLLYAFIWEAD